MSGKGCIPDCAPECLGVAPTPTSSNDDVTRDPYVLLMACLTFHKLPPELRKAIKECVDARSVAPVASERVLMARRLQSHTDLCKNEWYPWEEVFAPGMTIREPEIYEYAWFAQAPVLAAHPQASRQR